MDPEEHKGTLRKPYITQNWVKEQQIGQKKRKWGKDEQWSKTKTDN